MSIAEWATPLLGCCALLYTIPTLQSGVKLKHYILIAIAILALGFTWWNAWDNEDKIESLQSKSDSLLISNNSIKDSLYNLNTNINNLGLKFDKISRKIFVNDTDLLKQNFLEIVNGKVFNSPPISYPDQRHLNDSMIIKIKTIPKDYTVYILYNPDKETYNLVLELKNKLISMGYKIGRIDVSGMSANLKQYEFSVFVDNSKKAAEIDIAEQSFIVQ